jgi:uncharacterized protein YcbX
MRLTHIYIYPVKSLGGISVPEAEVSERGPVNDRRWMIVDEKGRFVSQREHARLALLQCELQGEEILIRKKGSGEVLLRLPRALEEGEEISATIWKNKVRALLAEEPAHVAISDFLEFSGRFVYMPEDSHRIVDPKYVPEMELVSFADGFPYLLIGQASLDDLNARLEVPVPMDRFRPNFVVEGGQPNEELEWAQLRIGEVNFEGRKPCARCTVTTVDQETAEKGKEPLRTLSRYMRQGEKVIFGENLIVTSDGMVRVGDGVEVLRRK